MKLATLIDGTRDGKLAVVSRDLTRAMPVPQVARRLQDALDDWAALAPKLEEVSRNVNASGGIPFNPIACMSPLPRAYHWVDGSAYLNHVELVRKARGATMPPEFLVDPLMYQGNSGRFLGPREPIVVADEAWGTDLEGEVAEVGALSETGHDKGGAKPGVENAITSATWRVLAIEENLKSEASVALPKAAEADPSGPEPASDDLT